MTTTKKFPDEIRDLVFESLSLTHDGIGVFDARDILLYCNDNMASMFSLPVESAVGMSFDELIKHNYEAKSGLLIEADSLDQWLETAHRMRRSKTFRSFEVDRVEAGKPPRLKVLDWTLRKQGTEPRDGLVPEPHADNGAVGAASWKCALETPASERFCSARSRAWREMS